MLEKQLEAKIVKIAKELGYLTYKFTSPSNRGVPDRIFINARGAVFFMEFKSDTGNLTKLQEKTIDNIEKYRVPVYIISNFEHGKFVLQALVHQSEMYPSQFKNK